jgi:hypothetical protein
MISAATETFAVRLLTAKVGRVGIITAAVRTTPSLLAIADEVIE